MKRQNFPVFRICRTRSLFLHIVIEKDPSNRRKVLFRTAIDIFSVRIPSNAGRPLHDSPDIPQPKTHRDTPQAPLCTRFAFSSQPPQSTAIRHTAAAPRLSDKTDTGHTLRPAVIQLLFTRAVQHGIYAREMHTVQNQRQRHEKARVFPDFLVFHNKKLPLGDCVYLTQYSTPCRKFHL